jgi:uncharacterized protein (DUF2267 family)
MVTFDCFLRIFFCTLLAAILNKTLKGEWKMTNEQKINTEPGEGNAGDQFLQQIKESIPESINSLEAATAVLCTLSQRVSSGQIANIFDSAPPNIRAIINRCEIHEHGVARNFNRNEFIKRISDHLKVDRTIAETVTRAVLTSLEDYVSHEALRGAKTQLSRDYTDLWHQAA